MNSRVALGVLVVVGLTLGLVSASQQARGAPVLIRRGIIPAVAADSAPGPAPTSTPAPPAAPILSVRINMVANELSYSGAGAVVPIEFRTLIEGPVPSGPQVTYLAGAIVEAHPADLCSWGPEFVTTALQMKASRQISPIPPKQEVVISFEGPVWHFNVSCPGKELRVPAFAEESLTGWLGLIFGGGSPAGVAVETPNYSGSPSCLHNRGVVRRSNQWGSVTIVVDILTPPCSPPSPP